jgi:Na+/H+ antiporter NhaD/arsenite permease-like protein
MRPTSAAWLVVAMASTLAGNFTVLGPIAGLRKASTAPPLADAGF